MSHIVLSLFSGSLLALSFPNLDFAWLAWVGLVPFFVVLESKKPLTGFLLSALHSLALFSCIFYWIWTLEAFSLPDYLLLGSYFSFIGGVFGAVFCFIRGKSNVSLVMIAPVVWVTLEFARSHAMFLSAPWMLLGHSQYLNPVLIQTSSYTGAFGLSFIIVMINATLAELFLEIRKNEARLIWPNKKLVLDVLCRSRSLRCSVGILFVSFLVGTVILTFSPGKDHIRISVIQGNTPQHLKWERSSRQKILNTYAALTRKAAQDAPNIIVWPETAVTGDVQHDPNLRNQLSELARETNSFLLVGSALSAKFSPSNEFYPERLGKNFNSLVLFNPMGSIVGTYNKIHLVPFGEYLPFRNFVPWPSHIAMVRRDILPGEEFTLFKFGENTVLGATICWENIFPDLFRQFVKRGARIMVNSANEGWFGDSAASSQFLAMSVFRAVENQVAIARATNTGISAFIDIHGQILNRVTDDRGKELLVDGYLTNDLPLSTGLTFYTKIWRCLCLFDYWAMCFSVSLFSSSQEDIHFGGDQRTI